jgi:tetratricopeptide (TPR) repeat protein
MARWPNPKNISVSRSKAARLAAAKTRHNPADKERTAWEVAELYWKGFVAFFRDLTTITLGLVSVFGFAVAAYLLLNGVRGRVIAVAPISVPQDLATKGYTSDVAAEGLQSALLGIISDAHSVKFPDVAMQADLLSVTVPGTALSTEALATQIRQYFRIYSHWNISGEITLEQKKLKLRLRMNGGRIYSSQSGGDPDHPDDLFVEAAQMIFEKINPYVLAASLSMSDPGKSHEIANRLLSPVETNDADAHNNLGLALRRQGKIDEAIAEYKKAIELDLVTLTLTEISALP